MSTVDSDRIRAELLAYFRSHAIEAVNRLENAGSDLAFHTAAADVKQLKEWMDWLLAVGQGRGGRFA